jgi:hypothetical protein
MVSDTNAEGFASNEPDEKRPMLSVRDYFWRPRYAKAWWAGIPLYWLAMGDPTRPAFLDGFADSGYVVFTHVIFLPITAILVLGFGYFRWLFEYGTPVRFPAGYDPGYGPRMVGRPHPSVDEYHPASPVYRYSTERELRRP